jgi:hypothetical protein
MIEAYFRSVDALLADSSIVREYNVHFDKRSLTQGYLRGDVIFRDESLLHFREFVSIGVEVDRMVYSYHYQLADNSLVFRYDNTPHYPDLPNAPHHRHDDAGGVAGILAKLPDLDAVLQEIELLMEPE